MPNVKIQFNRGIQPPAKIGTVILKPTANERLSYGQNIDVQTDEYGQGVVTPGPALVTLTDNSEFTGVPFLRSLFTFSSSNVGWLYVVEGLLGAINIVRRIKDVEPGETPSVDTTGSITVAHSGHGSVEVTDMVFRRAGGNNTCYIVGKDGTDGWIQSFSANAASPSLSVVSTLASFNTARTPKINVASDGTLYVAHAHLVDSVDTAGTYAAAAFTLPENYGVTEETEWNQFWLLAYSTDFAYTFNQRKAGGRSGIIVWNMVHETQFERDIPCPSRYISAVIVAPNGHCYAFGGLDEGKTTIYEFTGYGFIHLYSYVGDMPRSRHSVDFDGEGRLNWLTADGQWLRLDPRNLVFDHLGSIATGSSAGGIFTRAVGGSGNEFILASGSGSTYTAKRATLGNYIGDGAAGSDGVTTPLAISGLQFLPPRSTITGITVHLSKELASSEKIAVRLYKNGSTTPVDYMNLEHAVDGAISSKRKSIPVTQVNNFALGIAWKQTDALATAPPVAFAEVEWEPTIN